MTLVKFKQGHEHEQKPAVSMVIPGRRALGEDWVKVNIVPNPVTGGYDVQHAGDVEKPAMGQTVIVPGLSGLSTDEIDFILEGAIYRQEEVARHPRRQPVTDAEIEKMVNEMWMDYCEQKLKWFKGQTTLGPVGFNQREKPEITNWSGVR